MHSQEDPETRYLSFMLRLWRARDSNGEAVWRASLEEPGSHYTQSFGGTDAMFMFLQSQLGTEKSGDHAQLEQRE